MGRKLDYDEGNVHHEVIAKETRQVGGAAYSHHGRSTSACSFSSS